MVIHIITFEPLLEYMKSRDKSIYHLVRDGIVGHQTLVNLRLGKKAVTTDTINAICNYLHCDPSDIMRYTPDQEK